MSKVKELTQILEISMTDPKMSSRDNQIAIKNLDNLQAMINKMLRDITVLKKMDSKFFTPLEKAAFDLEDRILDVLTYLAEIEGEDVED